MTDAVLAISDAELDRRTVTDIEALSGSILPALNRGGKTNRASETGRSLRGRAV